MCREAHISVIDSACSDRRWQNFLYFLDGANNEVSVASFFISLAKELDDEDRDLRDKHLLLLDNCAAHKTPLVRKLLAAAGFSVIFLTWCLTSLFQLRESFLI